MDAVLVGAGAIPVAIVARRGADILCFQAGEAPGASGVLVDGRQRHLRRCFAYYFGIRAWDGAGARYQRAGVPADALDAASARVGSHMP